MIVLNVYVIFFTTCRQPSIEILSIISFSTPEWSTMTTMVTDQPMTSSVRREWCCTQWNQALQHIMQWTCVIHLYLF